jgi:aspartate ammonia-lyase
MLPAEALYGVHTARALENFPLAGRRAPGADPRLRGGQAGLRADQSAALGRWDEESSPAIEQACEEMMARRARRTSSSMRSRAAPARRRT